MRAKSNDFDSEISSQLPKLILADEPTSALDDESCENILELIRSFSQENKSKLIIVTHDQRLKNKFEDKLDLDALSV